MPIHPYDPNAQDRDDADIHDIDDIIDRILHSGVVSGFSTRTEARVAR